MLKKPPDFGGLTHKIRKIVFSYFRCPVFAFLVSRLNGNANPTAVQHSVNWASSGPFYINLCAQTTFVGLISVAPSGNSRSPMAVPAISGNAGTSKTGVRKVLFFQ